MGATANGNMPLHRCYPPRALTSTNRALAVSPSPRIGLRVLRYAAVVLAQAFAEEEERLLARALAMSQRAAAGGTGTENDPLDVDDAYDPGLRAAMEASVLPPSPAAAGPSGLPARPPLRAGPAAWAGEEAEEGTASRPIDADAELAASLAGGDDDEAYERHLSHPDGFEASYANAARRSFQAHKPASARDLLKREQEREYEEALALDRARDESMAEAAAREAAEQAAAEARALAAAKEAEEARERAHASVEARRAALLAQPEPAVGGAHVITVAVRLPEGGRLQRRFETEQRVGALYDWVHVAWADLSGIASVPADFTLVSHLPRTVHADRALSLRESGLTDRQCALFVESKE